MNLDKSISSNESEIKDSIASLGLNFTQIAWVVKDITFAERFFKDTMGITNFSKVETIRAKEFEGTYYGKPSNAEHLAATGYSGSTFIDLVQPV